MALEFDEEIQIPKPIHLGILGSRDDLSQEKIVEEIITPVLSVLGRLPERVILPGDGRSSIFLLDWADQMKLPTTVYESDWYRHGRRARIFRDSRIEKEATHFLVFLNKKSAYYEAVASRLARKGATVYTVCFKTCELEELVSK